MYLAVVPAPLAFLAVQYTNYGLHAVIENQPYFLRIHALYPRVDMSKALHSAYTLHGKALTNTLLTYTLTQFKDRVDCPHQLLMW